MFVSPAESRNGTEWKVVRHIEKVDTMRLFALFAIAVGLCHAQRAEGYFDRTLSVTGFVDLDLTTDAGGIRVTPGPPGTVRIHGILKAGDNWFTLGNVESRIRDLEAHPPIEQNGSRRCAANPCFATSPCAWKSRRRSTAACGRT